MLREGFTLPNTLASKVLAMNGLGGMAFSGMDMFSDKPKKREAPKQNIGGEMRVLYKNKMNYDEKPVKDIVLSAAQKGKVNPALLFSSAFGEGMNKAITKQDEVGSSFPDKDFDDFPVDGFFNYGLDRFGDNYERLKKFLPAGFDKQFKTYNATNEKNEKVSTAAFRTNEDALIAKSAMLNDASSQVQDYAKQKGVDIDASHLDYFTLAGYNGGLGNAKIMVDEYAKAKDKNDFVDSGLTSRKGIHKNIKGRLSSMRTADQLLNEDKPVAGKIPSIPLATRVKI